MTYELLDSGDGRKLERAGGFTFDRQAAQAHWRPRLDRATWARADAIHHRSETGGGRWEMRAPVPERFEVTYAGLRLMLKPTPFGHLGLFAEQGAEWSWLRDAVGGAVDAGRKVEVLNLFAYTGGSTLACAQAGATVCHVDASKGVVDWARENAALNGLAERPIRWIVDDCAEFLRREARRGRRYDALILDPPSFGRGARSEVWKIESGIGELLDLCRAVLADDAIMVHFSCHTPGFTASVLDNLLGERIDRAAMITESGELLVRETGTGGRPLPSGAAARWRRT